ncbi:MAG: alpha/beta fold hydrolase [Candidatus Onthovivens sp.]|nr:alpha/beta fold hydrolase [Candidatus Onthovivens sp.]
MKQEFSFTNSFGDTLFGHAWEIDNPDKVLFLVTGMAEHSSRYNDFALFLNENGYSVFCLDHYGQGKNGELGKPGKNYFFKMEKTIKEVIDDLKKKFGKPVYIFAHSMGSFVTQGFIQEYKGDVEKAVICGSNGKTILFKLGNMAAHLIVNKKNYNKEAKLLQAMSIGAYEKTVKDKESINSWISYNKENVKEYDRDELSGFKCSNGFYYEFFKGLASLHNSKKMKEVNKNIKILIVGGEDDPVGNCSKGLIKLNKEYNKLGISSELIIYPKMRHEILNEEENQKVYLDILNFLNK